MIRLHDLVGILLLSLASVAVCAQEQGATAQQQKFAIAADGPDASAPITHLSGRAPFFIVYDENGNRLEVIDNVYLRQEYGIGPRAAALLGEKNVTVLVGGVAGPKMKKVLNEKNIRFVHRKGTVQQVVDELRQ